MASRDPTTLSLNVDGTQLFPAALDDPSLGLIEEAFTHLPSAPGARLYGGHGDIGRLIASDGPIGRIAAAELGPSTCPVRLILFDKRDAMNWSLPLHQDRTIAVEARLDVEGFGPWSVKSGQLHVQPPQSIIEGMITVRVHLDDVDADNAPLDVLLGSHLRGRLIEVAIATLAETAKHFTCMARRGDIWAYRTAIVHGSGLVRVTGRSRRVLQVDYSCETLPAGLAWALQSD